MKTLPPAVQICLLFLCLLLVSTGLASAATVNLSGNILFSSLDGSAQDSDGLTNGVFTVDGDLVLAGTINCNDDPPLSGNASACQIRLAVSGDLSLTPGSGIFAENRRGGGHGGDILFRVGGDLLLQGPGAVVSSSRLTDGNSWRAGNITLRVDGKVELQTGTAVAASTPGGSAGTIVIMAEGTIQTAGLIVSGPSRTLLASRWTGLVLGGGTNGQSGGPISLQSHAAAEPAIHIGSGGIVASQGEEGGGQLVLLEGCGIEVQGLVASVSKQGGPSLVALRSGKGILVDGRDLGAAGSRLGRIRADGSLGGAAGYMVDLFAANDIQVLGPDPSSTAAFAVSSSPGPQAQRTAGGTIMAISLAGSLTAAGKAFEAGRLQDGNKGGTIDLRARNDVSLDGASLVAVGDFTSQSKSRAGGRIFARSYEGAVSWTFGVGDARPADMGISTANRGMITLTACTTVDTTGTQFPVTGPFPVENEVVCSPSAPQLPAGEKPLSVCNEPPVANAQTVETDEDTPVTITLTGSDPNSDPLTFSVTPPAHGSLGPLTSPTATSVQVVYTPDLSYNGSDSFTFQVDDGQGGTDTAMVTITIHAKNDPPSADDDAYNVNEGGTLNVPAPGVLDGDTDVDSDPLTAVLNTGPAHASSFTLNSDGSFTYVHDGTETTSDSFTYYANDGSADSNVATVTITIAAVNDEPTLDPIADPADINEDAGLQTVNLTGISAGGGGSESAQTLTVTAVSSNPGLIPNPTVTYTSPNVTGSLQYTPVANQSGSAVITVTVQDNGGTANGGDDTIQRTFTVDVLAVNDEPTLDPIADPADINEDTGLQTVNLTGIGAGGSGTESGQTLTVTAVSNNPGLIPNPTVSYTNPSATGSLSYTPVANQSGTAIITVTVQDSGGTANGGDDTIQRTFTVDVLAINDVPTLDPISHPVTINEDAGLQTVNLTGISAGIGESQTITITAVSSNPSVIPNPTVAYTSPNATGSLSYTPVANAFGNGITITVTVQDSGGTANGGVDTIQRTFTFDVLPVNDPPQFVDATLDYSTAGNTQLRGGEAATGASVAHVRDNVDLGENSTPSDIDGPGLFSYSLAVAPANGQATVNSDGTFTYEPNPGFAGPTDTFTVAVSDGGPPPNTSNLTVTVTISEMIWYVRDVVDANNPAAGDTGRSTNAFEVLGDVEPVVTDNDFIFVFRGDTGTTPLDGGIDIDNTGVKLYGEGVGLTIPVPGIGTLIPAGSRPRITNTGAAGGPEDNGVNVIATAASLLGVEIRGLDISGRDNAIDVNATGANSASVTISDNTISNDVVNGLEGVDFNDASTGTVTLAFHDNMLTTRGTALDFQRTSATGGAFVSALHDNVISGDSQASGIVITGTGGVVTFDATPGGPIDPVPGGTTVIGDPANRIGGPGLTLSNVTGALNFANPLSGTIAAGDLDIFTDSGAALSVTGGAGGFDLDVTPDAGVLVANAGPAAVVSGTDLNMQLNSLTSNNSTGAGVSLTNVTGTFSAPGGVPGSSITNAATTDFLISGGTANVTYGGTITDDVGQLVSISGSTGGMKSFTGAISDGPTANTGSGISLTGNGGTTISFSGGLALSTGANAAFTATGGGTLSVCDENPCNAGATGALVNTLTTTTGTALNVASTTISANSLEFRSISANGASNGIILNATGNLGGLSVKGTGSGSSGGTIQNITNRGASFIDAVNIALTNMNFTNANTTDGATSDGVVGGNENTDENGAIHLQNVTQVDLTGLSIDGAVQHGINGNNVTDLDITNTTIQNTGDEVWESGIYIFDLKGLASASRTNVFNNVSITNDSGQFNIALLNDDGTNDRPAEKDRLEVSNSQFTRNGSNALISDNVSILNSGTANFQVVVSGSTFASTVTCGSPGFNGACVSDNIQVDAGNTAAFDAVISSGNNFTNGNAGQSAVNISASGAGQGTFNVSNIVTTVRASQGINVALTTTNAAASLRGTIANNNLSTNVTNNAGSGIQMVLEGSGTMMVDVNNNTINGNGSTDFDYGIRGGSRAGSGVAHFQVNNNNVPSAEVAGVWFFSGNATAGETSQTCVNFVSNLIDGDPVDAFTDYFTEMYTGTTFQLQGLAGSGANATNVQNFIAGTDDDPSLTDPTVDAGSGTTVNYTNAVCQVP